MKPTSQQEISRLWLTWWKKQKQTDVVDFSVGTGQFIATWTKLFDEAHRHPNEFTHKRFLNLPFISDFETLENEESLSLITKIKHNLDKYILDLSLVGPSAHVKTSVHWIPGIALIYAITNPNFPMDMMLKTSGILSTTASLDTKKLHKQKYILLEETKD